MVDLQVFIEKMLVNNRKDFKQEERGEFNKWKKEKY